MDTRKQLTGKTTINELIEDLENDVIPCWKHMLDEKSISEDPENWDLTWQTLNNYKSMAIYLRVRTNQRK